MIDSLLVGNGFAVLVAASELAQRGHSVVVLTDGKPLGGHFAGLQIEGLNFDIGMVFLEEQSGFRPNANICSYDPNVRNDWIRFGDCASTWVRSRVNLIRAQTPRCLVNGSLMADYLISNRLDGMIGSSTPPPLSLSDPRHAAHKCIPGAYDSLTYAEASLANHGEHWHQQFVEPFVNKVFGVPSTEFLARFHRVAWAPLYYPETLRLASAGYPINLPEYPFWTTPSGFVGQLVLNLRNSLKESPNMSVITQSINSISHQRGKWTVEIAEGKTYHSHHLGIGLPPDRAGALFGVPWQSHSQAATVILLFATVQADRIRSAHACTMIVDCTYAAYRITNQDAVAGLNPPQHRIVLEASPGGISKLHYGKPVEEALLEELASLLGMDLQDARDKAAIRILRCFTAHNALSIPTAEEVDRASQMARLMSQATPGAVLTGSLLGYGVASLNDQIIQGLNISEKFA